MARAASIGLGNTGSGMALLAAELVDAAFTSIVLAILLVPFVSMLLTGYLPYLSWRERGDVMRMLVGDRIPPPSARA